MFRCGLLTLFASTIQLALAISWNETEYLFVFGDSYSTDGYKVSSGVDSPNPGYTSSNGPNWVEYLTSTYNQTAIETFNLAYGGATIDSALVTPYAPTVLSIVNQVSEFNTYLASKPSGASWSSTNSLFAFWIGINDVDNSFAWTNVTQSQLHETLMKRLFSQVDDLYNAGARNFLFLTVPPMNRAPLFLDFGSEVAGKLETGIKNYNTYLTQSVRNFQETYSDLGSIIVFDTQPIFNTLLDMPQTFGFVNVTGYCTAYENGTFPRIYQVEGCAPVSSYFWLNSLHPLFTVHDVLAKAITTALAGYPATQIST